MEHPSPPRRHQPRDADRRPRAGGLLPRQGGRGRQPVPRRQRDLPAGRAHRAGSPCSPTLAHLRRAGPGRRRATDGDVHPTVGGVLRGSATTADLPPGHRDRPGCAPFPPSRATAACASRAPASGVPAGVELDLGATAKAVAADRARRAGARRARRRGAGQPRRRHRHRGTGAGTGWQVHVQDRTRTLDPGQPARRRRGRDVQHRLAAVASAAAGRCTTSSTRAPAAGAAGLAQRHRRRRHLRCAPTRPPRRRWSAASGPSTGCAGSGLPARLCAATARWCSPAAGRAGWRHEPHRRPVVPRPRHRRGRAGAVHPDDGARHHHPLRPRGARARRFGVADLHKPPASPAPACSPCTSSRCCSTRTRS